MSRYAILFLIIFAGVFSSCEKNTSTGSSKMQLLPNITQEGKNTFGCVLNGVVWLPRGNINIPATSVDYNFPPNLIIKANDAFKNETLELNLQTDGTVSSFTLNDTLPAQIAKFKVGDKEFKCDSMKSGNLTFLKFDNEKRIISGTFYFNAIGDSMSYDIRLGRFDLTY